MVLPREVGQCIFAVLTKCFAMCCRDYQGECAPRDGAARGVGAVVCCSDVVVCSTVFHCVAIDFWWVRYGVATMSRRLKIIGLFCRT